MNKQVQIIDAYVFPSGSFINQCESTFRQTFVFFTVFCRWCLCKKDISIAKVFQFMWLHSFNLICTRIFVCRKQVAWLSFRLIDFAKSLAFSIVLLASPKWSSNFLTLSTSFSPCWFAVSANGSGKVLIVIQVKNWLSVSILGCSSSSFICKYRYGFWQLFFFFFQVLLEQ